MANHANSQISFDGASLDVDAVRRVSRRQATCSVAPEALAKAEKTRASFEDVVASGVPIYGVTTGYGEMIYMLVDPACETALQTNLVRSHSAGVGPFFAEAEARAIVAARLNALSKGYSAVRPVVLERLALYLNNGLIPAIPEIGSLGASGDLAPLSHIASTVIGEGYFLGAGGSNAPGDVRPAGEVLANLGITPGKPRSCQPCSLRRYVAPWDRSSPRGTTSPDRTPAKSTPQPICGRCWLAVG